MGKKLAVRTLCALGVLAACSPTHGDDGRFPTLGGRPLVPARYISGCGTDALYACLELNSVKVSYADFIRQSGLTSARDSVDMARLWQLARDCGAHAHAIRVRNGAGVLRKIMADLSIRTAVVHLKAAEGSGRRDEEHFSAVLRVGDTLRIVGEESYERDVAPEWESRWSGAVLLVSAKPIVLSAPVEVLQIEALECQPAKLDLDRKGEPGVIQRTITVRPRTDHEATRVTAEIRGMPGTVKAVRRMGETGAWEIDLEFGPWLDNSAMSVGAVVISGSPDGETNNVELPVCVR